MKHTQRGFTLLEIMLVLSLLGVLLTLVASALLAANRAAYKAQRYAVSLDEMRAAQTFLRTSISQALPLQTSGDKGEGLGFFKGSVQRLEFFATLPGELGGGIQLHTLTLHGTEGRRVLQVAFTQVRSTAGDAAATPWGEPQVLLRNVETLDFNYLGLSDKGEPTGWLAYWPWPSRLPSAVRISARVKGPIPWLTEVVALRLDLSDQAGRP